MDFDQAAMWRRLSNDPGNYYTQVAEPERYQFRQFVENLLHQGTVTVEFVKSDGSTRAMICTLSENFGAKYNRNHEVTENVVKPRRRPTQEVRTVWDCGAGAWRSFRWDRLKKVEFTIV
jgi:hypothetical protein